MLHRLHGTTTGAAARSAPRPPTTTAADATGSRRWWVLALLSVAQFMLIIDVTVVNVALPSIGRDLALDRTQLTWIVTAYTLLFGSLLVLGGRLADSFGRRPMFLAGLTSFTIASPTGEGLTTAVHFTRERRCTLKDSFRFV